MSDDPVKQETITLSTGEKIQVIQYDIPEARMYDLMFMGVATPEVQGFVYNMRFVVERKEKEETP